jgi:CheY-like chemotaxis protein
MNTPNILSHMDFLSDFLVREDAPIPRILIVDDDPVFCRLMAAIGEKMGVQVEYRGSLKELYKALPKLKFDAAIVDYDLGCVTGVQLSRYLEKVSRGKPLILVSNYKDIPRGGWSNSVRAFVGKGSGEVAILRQALRCIALR